VLFKKCAGGCEKYIGGRKKVFTNPAPLKGTPFLILLKDEKQTA